MGILHALMHELFSFNVYVYSNLYDGGVCSFSCVYCMLMVVFPEIKKIFKKKKKKIIHMLTSI